MGHHPPLVVAVSVEEEEPQTGYALSVRVDGLGLHQSLAGNRKPEAQLTIEGQQLLPLIQGLRT